MRSKFKLVAYIQPTIIEMALATNKQPHKMEDNTLLFVDNKFVSLKYYIDADTIVLNETRAIVNLEIVHPVQLAVISNTLPFKGDNYMFHPDYGIAIYDKERFKKDLNGWKRVILSHNNVINSYINNLETKFTTSFLNNFVIGSEVFLEMENIFISPDNDDYDLFELDYNHGTQRYTRSFPKDINHRYIIYTTK